VDLVTIAFPASSMPVTVDNALVDKCKCILEKENTQYVWCDKGLPLDVSESQLALFLNKICKAIVTVSKCPVLRKWDASYCNTILRGSPIHRKPDVVLLDSDFDGKPEWKNVHAVAELTTSATEHERIISTVTDKTFVMLGVQANRVFVPIISAWGASKFRITITDRQGQLRTQTFDIEGGLRRADLRTLIHLLVGLCFGRGKVMGYDETMLVTDEGDINCILCAGKPFKVINLIYATQSLLGRATRVWVVEYNKRKYILKDAWVEKCRPVSEAEHLKTVAGVEGVSEVFCSEDIEGISTGNLRRGLYDNENRERIRRRIVTSTCGSHIATFRSKRELISALKDIVFSMSCYHNFILRVLS
jgi:hypothetical protein